MILCTECRSTVFQSPDHCADLDVWPGHHVPCAGFNTGYASMHYLSFAKCQWGDAPGAPRGLILPSTYAAWPGTAWTDHGECASPPPATGVGELGLLINAARSLTGAARALRDVAGYDAERARNYDSLSDAAWDLAKAIAQAEICT